MVLSGFTRRIDDIGNIDRIIVGGAELWGNAMPLANEIIHDNE